MLHDTPPTHQRGGTLNALITHDVTECPDCVTVDDVRLSDPLSTVLEGQYDARSAAARARLFATLASVGHGTVPVCPVRVASVPAAVDC